MGGWGEVAQVGDWTEIFGGDEVVAPWRGAGLRESGLEGEGCGGVGVACGACCSEGPVMG